MSKLVRDLIPEVIPANRLHLYSFSKLNDKEYRTQLNKKLLEETNEYLESESIEELADILEVIDAIIKFNNFDKQQIQAVKANKKDKRGGFENRIFMEAAGS